MSKKVKIELRPYDALAILTFLREYINEENRGQQNLTAIHESVDAYEKEIYKKIDSNMLDDAILENKINEICERQPKR